MTKHLNSFRHPLVLLLLLLTSVQALGVTLEASLTDQSGAAIEDAVVYVKTVNGSHAPATPQKVIVDQINEMFVPHVRAITVGSSVGFPNSDHIRHHVYSFSKAKTFELPLYIGVPAEPIIFDKAGLVTLGCNIHDHMLGYILVLDTPWFAEVHGGKAVIPDLPAGQLAVVIWHPRMAQEKDIELTLTASANQTVAVKQQLELRPERMVRRAPRRGSEHY